MPKDAELACYPEHDGVAECFDVRGLRMSPSLPSSIRELQEVSVGSASSSDFLLPSTGYILWARGSVLILLETTRLRGQSISGQSARS